MEALKIIALAVLSAAFYGCLHDSITVRICLEYFTVAHPPIFGGTDDPWLLALGWGVLATWWVGAGFGALLAYVARRGPGPRLRWRAFAAPIGAVLLASAVFAFLGGVAASRLAASGDITLPYDIASVLPKSSHEPFITTAFAHLWAYSVAAAGATAVVAGAFATRRRMMRVYSSG